MQRRLKIAVLSGAVVLFTITAFSFTARILRRFDLVAPLLSDVSFSKVYYADRGEILRLSLSSDEKYRLFVPFNQIPSSLKEAVMLYEDRYFYRHPGINPAALLKGAWASYVVKKRLIGASTVTMQTARIIYQLKTRSVWGKLKQILCALWLELLYTKDEIFEAYLNLTPYSYNIEGVGAASLIYFNSRTQDLTDLEALTLAVVPQDPNARKPSSVPGFKAMKAARDRLFEAWKENHPDDGTLRRFLNLPMQIKDPSDLGFDAPHAVTYLSSREETPEVFTAINLSLQKKMERILKQFVLERRALGIKNGAFILIDYETMEVKAAAGSADFWDDAISGQVNGFAAKRTVGSTLKTFIYALALEKGLIHPMTLLKDSSKSFGIYAPENSDYGFMGPIMAYEALVKSRNIPAIDVLSQVGFSNFRTLLEAGGVSGLKPPEFYGLGLGIGSFEASLLEVAGLYGALANGGEYRKPAFTKGAYSPETRILSKEASFIALDMLKHNPAPSRYVARNPAKRDTVYFKTGTSSSFKDAWTAGVFGKYVLVVWIGNFSGEGNPSFWGGKVATPLLFEMIEGIKAVDSSLKTAAFMPGDNLHVTTVDVCARTGDLPGRYCPEVRETYFIPGVSPIKVSDVYRPIYIDIKTGLRACRHDPLSTKVEIYEFWSSEDEKMFEGAGIIKRKPPRYLPGCSLDEAGAYGSNPVILSPMKDIIYMFSKENLSEKKMTFKADTETDSREVFWFMGEEFVGKSKKGETLFIEPRLGTFAVKAVDDLGRASSQTLRIELKSDPEGLEE